MVSRLKSIIKPALCLAGMLMAASTSQAQLSNVPKRYRTKTNTPQEFGRMQRKQQHGQQQRKKTNLRKLEDGSMPMPSPKMMSFEMIANNVDMSLPSDAENMSMPQKENSPPAPEKKPEEKVSLTTGGSDGSSSLILASFLAGISAFVVGAIAFFVKMRRTHGRQFEECEDRSEDMDMRAVSFADDLDDIEEGGEEYHMRSVYFTDDLETYDREITIT